MGARPISRRAGKQAKPLSHIPHNPAAALREILALSVLHAYNKHTTFHILHSNEVIFPTLVHTRVFFCLFKPLGRLNISPILAIILHFSLIHSIAFPNKKPHP